MTRVYVSIGSNQNREANVRMAVAALGERFSNLVLSSVYETEAVGFAGDPFFNLAAGFDTDLELEQVMDVLHDIEASAGRERTEKRYGPRTLDIDVLTYGDIVSDDDTLDVPRSEITKQAYVLHPLAEIAPRARHPALGESYAELEARLKLPAGGMHRIDLGLRRAAVRA
jgi:2-amino-4-hydroxy-6-hydroxymethyldihydropteridine diphosphokinase